MNNDLANARNESTDDADQMIDALLGEFVPSDPARRRCPPDLTRAILQKLADSESDLSSDERADSDPIVDSLLAEFLPSEPEKRPTPPDLSHAILKRLASDGHEEPSDVIDNDPVVDALLPEFVSADPRNRTVPPDLSGAIVNQLGEVTPPPVVDATPVPTHDAGEAAPVATSATVTASKDDANWKRRFVTVVTAIAASVVALIWYSSSIDTVDPIAIENPAESNSGNLVAVPEPDVAPGNDSSNEASRSMLADSGTNESSSDPGSGVRQLDKPAPRGVSDPNADRIAAASNQTGPETPSVVPDGSDASPATPITLVAEKGRETAKQYWDRMGIKPTPDASASEIARRMKNRLGVELSQDVLNDPERLQELLAEGANADELAKRWLALTSNLTLPLVEQRENRELVKELSSSVSGKAPFDETLVSLIDGSNENSADWYRTLGRGGSEAIAKHLARLSFNADLRCVRCHDSHIGRSGTQDDYWSFVALVRNGVERKGTDWVVADRPNSRPTFFELLDGRQRMASAKVSGYLFRAEQPITDFKDWTRTLAGSDALAGSMVDSLWTLVHGRPLKPSPVDAFAPPYDSSLDELHRLLAEDLKANQFDVTRTLALIISSPMSQRSVPKSLRGDAIMTTSERDQAEALQLVSAFAASVEAPQSGMKQRIDVAMRRVGGKLLTGDQGTLLAQPITENPRSPKARTRPQSASPVISLAQKLSVDFPGDDASLPVAWLRTIEDFDLQVQHLAHLSGRDKVPAEVSEIADRLKDSGSREAALSRLWWILRK